MAKARVRHRAFFCAALAGDSENNLCVNSDLTVSCSNHDVDGEGHIGDLNRQSMPEILASSRAQHFREELARGWLPTRTCARCCDLHTVSKDQAEQLAEQRHLPTFLMMENTSACNLHCKSCSRPQIRRMRTKMAMSLDDVRRVAGELKAVGITSLAYLGHGEPFLSKTIGQELEIVRNINPEITINTSTNAMLIDCDEKRAAAMLLDRMQISLDGINQHTVSKYQRGLDFETAYRNMSARSNTATPENLRGHS